MKETFDDGTRLEKLYGVQVPKNVGSSDSASSNSAIVLKSGDEATKKFGMMGRFRWVLKDKAKFEKLIIDLREYNDCLHALLRLREASVLENLAQSILLQGVTTVESSQNLSQASMESVMPQNFLASNARRDSRQVIYRQLQKSVEMKRFFLQQSTFVAQGSLSQPRSMVLDQKLVRYAPLNSPSDVRLMADVMLGESVSPDEPSAASTQAVIDWRDTNVDDHAKSIVLNRLNRLAELLSSKVPKPEDLRVLECLGYFEDSYMPRHGILHRVPSGSESRPPVTLFNLMARQYEKVPDLNERFVLARALATSVNRLHDCGWLHTSFRSSNVLFFHQHHVVRRNQDAEGAPWISIDFGQPYLIGFLVRETNKPRRGNIGTVQIHFGA
jgi:hypothetical protein